jgi:hypothetical protein
MFPPRLIAAASLALFVATAAPATIVAAPSQSNVVIKTFANCTAMHKVYPHGVGKVGAKDHVTSGKPVKNFFVNTKLYLANKKSDRDGDGVACEAH